VVPTAGKAFTSSNLASGRAGRWKGAHICRPDGREGEKELTSVVPASGKEKRSSHLLSRRPGRRKGALICRPGEREGEKELTSVVPTAGKEKRSSNLSSRQPGRWKVALICRPDGWDCVHELQSGAGTAGKTLAKPSERKSCDSDLLFLAGLAPACSTEHMRYFRQLFAFFTRGRARHEQLQLPFHVKASRRAALLRPRGWSR
jgi:hypothetical protein